MAATNAALPPGNYVDPAQAQGAQIPLQTFTLPEFPPSARGLRALTLTSDIKLDEYQDLLTKPFTVPPLPRSIESLTLELFSLGYPPGWLAALADRLPNTKSLVVYSQLLGGTSTMSAADAVNLFRKLPGLRALHLLDVFARTAFFESIAPYVTYKAEGSDARRGLMFLEINYTVQKSDADFLPNIQAAELPMLIGPGLVTCAFNVSEPDVTDDPEDPNNISARGERITEVVDESKEKEKDAVADSKKDGVVALNKTLTPGLVKALISETTRPVNLRVLNSTIFTMTLSHLKTVLSTQKGLMVLIATLEVDESDVFKKELLDILPLVANIEQVEIVVNPSLQFYMAISNSRANAIERAFPSKADMEALVKKCERLTSFKASVLRSASLGKVEWEKKDNVWTGGYQDSESK